MRDETAKAGDKLYQSGTLDAVAPVARYPMRTGRLDLRRLGLGA